MKLLASRSHSRIAGFTLLEVLVASVILFSSLAAISLIYRGAYLSSDKAELSIKINAMAPSIVSTIQQEIKQLSKSNLTSAQGQGEAWDVTYRWEAQVNANAAAPRRLDPNSGVLTDQPNKYKLWQVDLVLSYQKKSRSFEFLALGWTDE